MTDNTELKRLAEHHRSLGHAYTVATPSAVLALIAENEELGRYLCTCRDCGGEGALHTRDWHSYGHMEPPEPVMEKCGECDGTGLLGEIQDLYQVITERDQLKAELEKAQLIGRLAYNFDNYKAVLDERDQLKAENERLRADYAGLARFNPEWDRVAAAQDSVREHMAMVVQLKAENAGLKTGYEAYEQVNAELKAEVEGLRKDAELHQQLQRAAKELPFGWDITLIVERFSGWVELTDPHGTVVELDDLPADLAVQVSMAIDAALGQGEQS